MSEEKIIDLDPITIQKYQQNKHPILFIDRITEIVPGSSAKGFKNFSYTEWYFPAHYSDEAVVPGFITIEALTQVFIMTFLSLPQNKGKKTNYISIEKAIFRKRIFPGDKLEMEAHLHSFRRGIAKGMVIGTVNSEKASEIQLTVALPDVLSQFKPRE